MRSYLWSLPIKIILLLVSVSLLVLVFWFFYFRFIIIKSSGVKVSSLNTIRSIWREANYSNSTFIPFIAISVNDSMRGIDNYKVWQPTVAGDSKTVGLGCFWRGSLVRVLYVDIDPAKWKSLLEEGEANKRLNKGLANCLLRLANERGDPSFLSSVFQEVYRKIDQGSLLMITLK